MPTFRPFATALALALAASSALAQSTTFTVNTNNASWFTPGNWSSAAIPTLADEAIFRPGNRALLSGGSGTAGSVIITGNSSTFSRLTVDGIGSGIAVSNGLTVGSGGILNITGGAIVSSASGTLNDIAATNSAEVNVDGAGTQWNITGTVTQLSGAYASYLTVSNGATVNAAAIDLQDGQRLQIGGSSDNTAGTINATNGIITSSGTSTISADFTGTSTLASSILGGHAYLYQNGPGTLVLSATNNSLDQIRAEGGILSITGSTSVTTQIGVGLTSGEGELRVENGGKLTTANSLTIFGGTTTVTGLGSNLTANSVGMYPDGTASLVLADRATFTVGDFVSTFGSNTISVSGSSVFSTTSNFTLGDATLSVTDSGTVNVAGSAAFSQQGGPATVLISGSRSAFNVAGNGLDIALLGHASVTIEAGGKLNAGSATVGSIYSGSRYTGSITVTGTGSTFTSTSGIWVGTTGTGIMRIENGGSFTDLNTGANRIGASATSRGGYGSVTVTGTGSSLTMNSLTIGGRNNVGVLLIEDGASVSVDALSLTDTAFSSTAGTGSVVQTGGTMTIASLFSFGRGTSSYSLQGGVLRTGASITATTGSTGTVRTFELAGGTLQFTGNSLANTLATTLRNSTTSTIDTQNFTSTLSGTTTGGGTLRKAGTGTLNITATNAYTGGTQIAAGTVAINSGSALGTGTLAFTGNGGLTSTASTFANAITLDSGVTGTISNNSAFAVSSTISGAGNLAKAGTGTLTLTGSQTYTGNTSINAGTLQVGTGVLASSGTLLLSGGALLPSNSGTIGNVVGLTATSTISGGSNVTFSNTLTNAATTGTLAITNTGSTIFSGPINLSNSSTTRSLTFNVAGAPVLVSGAISNGGGSTSGGFAKVGSGTLTLSGSNSYSGSTTATAGLLILANNSAIGTSTLVLGGGNVRNDVSRTFANSGLLTANSTISGAANFGLSGTLANTNNNTLTVSNSGTTTFGGIDLSNSGSTRTLTISTTGGPVNIDGPIANGGSAVSGHLTKTGSGTLTLLSANTYTGTTSITGGVLAFTSGSLGSALSIGGGELRWNSGTTASIAGPITLSTGGGTFNTNGYNASFSGSLTGSGAFIKKGEGTLTLGATSNATSGTNFVLGGTVRFGANNALAASRPLVISSIVAGGTATLDLNGYNLTVSQLTFNGTTAALTADRNVNNLVTGSGTLTLTGNAFYWFGFGDETTDPGSSTISGNLALSSGTNHSFQVMKSANATGPELTIDAIVSGSGGLIKQGFTNGDYGTMALNAANTYTGTTIIYGGLLDVKILANGGTASGIGASSSAATNLILTGGTLRYTGTGGSTDRLFRIGEAITSSSAGLDASGSGAIAFTNTGTITGLGNQNTTLILSGTNTGDNTFAPQIADNVTTSNALAKDGIGKWILTGSNTYTGGTTITGGTLQLGNGGSTGSVTGAITNNATLAFNRSDAFTAANIISGSGTVRQIGTGAVTLTGSNSYSGGTVISSGTLIADNNNAVGTSTVTVSGGVFVIANGRTVSNTVSLTGGSLGQQVGNNTSFASLKTYQGNVLGGVATTASFLGGTSSGVATITSTFSNTSAATNDIFRRSEILSLSNVPVVNMETGETDKFVLRLTIASLPADSFLGWYNPETGLWTNAVLGNFGGTMFFAGDGAYNPLTDYNLGTYGYDSSTGTVWAVLNHNSDFAVIPEPSTWALIGLGLVGLVIFRRRASSLSAKK